jgi:hypothetical protein
VSADAKARESQRLVAQIKPLLAGKPPEVQSAALADLLSMWIAGHIAPVGRVTNWPVLVTTGDAAIVVYTGRGKWEEQPATLDPAKGGDPVRRFLDAGFGELLAQPWSKK